MDYASAEGSTSFTGLRVGVNNSNGGVSSSELDVSGGNLTINSGSTSTLGYQGSGTIGVSGGTLAIDGSDQFWFGNTYAAIANVTGGDFIVGDQFLLSRDGGTSTINLSGTGIFDVTGSSGTSFGSNSSGGVATINLNGNGIFEQTGSNSINLVNNFNINFGSGSLGQFSLLGDSASTLDSLITGGHFEINGASDTTLADYNVIGAANDSSQGIIELAAPASVPEPSTWAMMLGGLALLVGMQRKRFSKA